MKFDYGPMKQYEKKASSGDLSALESEEGETINPKDICLTSFSRSSF